MIVLTAIYNNIISPIALLIEVVFCFYLKRIGVGGEDGVAGAVIAVSLAVNFLTLPLYNVAEKLQEAERETQKRLLPGIKRIKAVFHGDERFMMLQAFYRENKWHPFQAFRSSLSILIEIPFFIAAYRFLSHCPALEGASFLFLKDLSSPDGLVPLPWGARLNLLPVLMTAVNVASSAVYLKGLPLRDKVQTYSLALLFLVLLYASPSGLVCYWLLNNLFSLAKNIVVAKCRHPARLVYALLAILLVTSGLYIAICHPPHNIARRLTIAILPGVLSLMPLALHVLRRINASPLREQKGIAGQYCTASKGYERIGGTACLTRNNAKISRSSFTLFLTSAAGLALLCGFVLPSQVIGTSPIEFSFIGNTPSPLSYIWHCLIVFTGLFAVWPLLIYKMFGTRVRQSMPYLFSLMLITALLNVSLFRNNYGRMDTFFHLDDSHVLLDYSAKFMLFPVVAAILTAAVLYAIHRLGWEKHLVTLNLAICAAALLLGISKLPSINATYTKYAAEHKNDDGLGAEDAIYHLSKTQKNVVVLFYDRAISSFFPYILRQFPQLKKDFAGFVYYPNTLSFCGDTLTAAPAMMGGYEYTPEAMNERPNELLRIKHNEATLLLPRLFCDAGWAVTVTDPPYPNYEWSGDASPFEPYSNMKCSFVQGSFYTPYMERVFGGDDKGDKSVIVRGHAMGFSLMQALLPFFRYLIYDGADYLQGSRAPIKCIAQYGHLYFLPEITDGKADLPSYLFIENDLTHTPTLLSEDDSKEVPYMPAANAAKDKAAAGEYKWKETDDLEYYQVNAAAMLLTARWLNRLRELGLYDNTRIIIVADHGKSCYTPAWPNKGTTHAEVNPLLLVKDFGDTGEVRTDSSFMTNADTPFLATKGLDLGGVNPFTGKALPKTADKGEVRIFSATEDNSDIKKAHKWVLGEGRSVCSNIFDEGNWKKIPAP